MNRRTFAIGGLVAVMLLVGAIVRHFGQNSASSLLEDGSLDRQVEGLKELGTKASNSILFGAERQAYMNGFQAGERQAETSVMEDDSDDNPEQPSLLQQSVMSHLSKLKLDNSERRSFARMSSVAQKLNAEAKLLAKAQRLKEMEGQNLKRTANLENEYASALKFKTSSLKADAERRLSELDSKRRAQVKPGTPEAASLLAFCSDSFPNEPEVQRFCYDRMLSSPSSETLLHRPSEEASTDSFDEPSFQPPSDTSEGYRLEQVNPGQPLPPGTVAVVDLPMDSDAPASLAGAEDEEEGPTAALASGLPPADGYLLEPVIPGEAPPAGAVGMVGIPESELEQMQAAGVPEDEPTGAWPDGRQPVAPQPVELATPEADETEGSPSAAGEDDMQGAAPRELVEVDGGSLSTTIHHAHAMGLKGVPLEIVYHPANGEPKVYKLDDSAAPEERP